MIIRKAVNKDIDGISDLIQKVTDNNPNNYSLEQIVPPLPHESFRVVWDL